MTRDQLVETMARAMCRDDFGEVEHEGHVVADRPENWTPYIPLATAALTAIEAAGMRVVPVEPTEAMIQGWINEWHEGVGVIVLNDLMRRGYRSMLAAAQEDSTSE